MAVDQDDFYVYHGFSLPLNKDEDVTLFGSLDQLIDWAYQRLGMEGISLDIESSASAAALSGHQSASIHASASIPGTSSSLLASLSEMSLLLSDAEGDISLESLEARASRAFRLELKITRRLSAFCLHRHDWGTKEVQSMAPELVGGTGGKLDVRIISVLSMMVDRANVKSEEVGSSKRLGFDFVICLIVERSIELLKSNDSG